MTSFALQSVAGPVISTAIAKDKGSVGNRVDCAGAHVKNNVTSNLLALGTAGATAGAAYLVKPDAFKNFARITIADIEHSIKDMFNKIKSLPTSTKAAGIIGLVGLGAITYINNRAMYKMGQIDQKYTDKAQTQQIVK